VAVATLLIVGGFWNAEVARAETLYSQPYVAGDVGDSLSRGLFYSPGSTAYVTSPPVTAYTVAGSVVDRIALAKLSDGTCPISNRLTVIQSNAGVFNASHPLVYYASTTSLCLYTLGGGDGDLDIGVEFVGFVSSADFSFIARGSVSNTGATFDTANGDVLETLGGYAFQLCNTTCTEEFYDLGELGYDPGINFSQNTRFLDLDISASTTNPKDVHFDIDYFIDPTEVDPDVSAFNPTMVSVSLAKRPSTDFTTYSFLLTDVTATGSQRLTLSDSSIDDNGTFDVLVRFSNAGVPFGSQIPFEDSYVYSAFTIVSKAITDVPYIDYYDGLSPTEIGQCGLSDLSACITNSLAFLFVPSENTFSSITSLNESLETKFPFAYLYDIAGVFEGIFTTSAANASEISVPFGDYGDITIINSSSFENLPMAPLMRGFLVAFLWLIFAVTVYRRTLKIFNPAPL